MTTDPGSRPVRRSESRSSLVVVGIVAALGVLLSASHRIYDYDVWQHLVVGKAIWQLHAVPTTHLWTWPSYGQPEVLPSWLFRALLWPFWSLGGVPGLFVWRWLTTLTVFVLLWVAARRMGARGLAPLVVLVLCSLVFRRRTLVRPETLAAIFFALDLMILEGRRQGGKDRSIWLVPIACLWANAHISYYLGLVLIAIHAAEELLARVGPSRARREASGARGRRSLVLIGLAALAVSFVNPFGARALWQPFDYFLHLRHEPIFQGIAELQPLDWSVNWRNGLPLLLLGWPALAIGRARRAGIDRVEFVMCALFSLTVYFGERFTGFYALAAAPYVARDLAELLAARGIGRSLPTAGRAAIGALSCIAIGALEWTQASERLGVAVDWSRYPVAACDFIAREGVRGRGFNYFHTGGYQLFRFWPDRDRLPFMDIHQSGTPEIRYLYAWSSSEAEAWNRLDRQFRFEYALLPRPQRDNDQLLDRLDADSTWSLVFVDDAAALYVRRDGPLAGLASRFGYRAIPGGPQRLESLRSICQSDSVECARIVDELDRAARSSRYDSDALSLRANVDLMRGRWADAREHLRHALGVNPALPRAHERLGVIALQEDHAREALAEFLAEAQTGSKARGLDLWIGRARQQLGDVRGARDAYARALARDPDLVAARDSLAALERRGAR